MRQLRAQTTRRDRLKEEGEEKAYRKQELEVKTDRQKQALADVRARQAVRHNERARVYKSHNADTRYIHRYRPLEEE